MLKTPAQPRKHTGLLLLSESHRTIRAAPQLPWASEFSRHLLSSTSTSITNICGFDSQSLLHVNGRRIYSKILKTVPSRLWPLRSIESTRHTMAQPKSQLPLILGLTAAGGIGYYLYTAGGNPKVAEKQFEGRVPIQIERPMRKLANLPT